MYMFMNSGQYSVLVSDGKSLERRLFCTCSRSMPCIADEALLVLTVIHVNNHSSGHYCCSPCTSLQAVPALSDENSQHRSVEVLHHICTGDQVFITLIQVTAASQPHAQVLVSSQCCWFHCMSKGTDTLQVAITSVPGLRHCTHVLGERTAHVCSG